MSMETENSQITTTEEACQIQLTRSEQREQAFMLLFSQSFADDEEPIEEHVEDNHQLYEGGVCGYAQAVVAGITDRLEELDTEISKYLKQGWSISRISRPSLAILRLAFYEIKYVSTVPASVAVNEAVELAKKYTIDENKFINGILGSYLRANPEEAE